MNVGDKIKINAITNKGRDFCKTGIIDRSTIGDPFFGYVIEIGHNGKTALVLSDCLGPQTKLRVQYLIDIATLKIHERIVGANLA